MLKKYIGDDQDASEYLFEEKKKRQVRSREEKEFFEQHELYSEGEEDSFDDPELNKRLNK